MGEAFMQYHVDPYIRAYDDRKMAKWLGFYLSEHTAEMTKEEELRTTVRKPLAAMSELEITANLEQAYLKQNSVYLQLATRELKEQQLAELQGNVLGFQANEVYVSDENGAVQLINLELIQAACLVDSVKWSEIS